MVPNKELLENINTGKWGELSTCFNNMCNSGFEYAMKQLPFFSCVKKVPSS